MTLKLFLLDFLETYSKINPSLQRLFSNEVLERIVQDKMGFFQSIQGFKFFNVLLGTVGWIILLSVWIKGTLNENLLKALDNLPAVAPNYHVLGVLVTYPFWASLVLAIIFWVESQIAVAIPTTLLASLLLIFLGGVMDDAILGWALLGRHNPADLLFAGTVLASVAVTVVLIVLACWERKVDVVHKSLLA